MRHACGKLFWVVAGAFSIRHVGQVEKINEMGGAGQGGAAVAEK